MANLSVFQRVGHEHEQGFQASNKGPAHDILLPEAYNEITLSHHVPISANWSADGCSVWQSLASALCHQHQSPLATVSLLLELHLALVK